MLAPSITECEKYLSKKDNFKALEELVFGFGEKVLQLKEVPHEEFKKEISWKDIGMTKKLVDSLLEISEDDIPSLEDISINHKSPLSHHQSNWGYGIMFGGLGTPLLIHDFIVNQKIDTTAMVFVGMGLMCLKLAIEKEALVPNGSFHRKSKNISYTSKTSIEGLPIIAHEYTHFLQNRFAPSITKKTPLIEGHARLVEYEVAKILSAQSPLFMKWVLRRIISELVDSYKRIGNKNDYNIDKGLISPLKGEAKSFGAFYRLHGGLIYSLGTAVTQVAQDEIGAKELSKAILNEDYSFMSQEKPV